jgi:hypothetical protein
VVVTDKKGESVTIRLAVEGDQPALENNIADHTGTGSGNGGDAYLIQEFKKNVAIPYFKDIFKDLVAQSDDKSKGINKVTLLTYTNLPGIIGERFFAVLDLSKNEYIDLREFVHGFFKVYYSNLETKIKLSFDV